MDLYFSVVQINYSIVTPTIKGYRKISRTATIVMIDAVGFGYRKGGQQLDLASKNKDIELKIEKKKT